VQLPATGGVSADGGVGHKGAGWPPRGLPRPYQGQPRRQRLVLTFPTMRGSSGADYPFPYGAGIARSRQILRARCSRCAGPASASFGRTSRSSSET
jgi:hypothetical protein